ncbi:hypothetical protein ACS0TW_28320, partial [Klebsiella michiganensis]
ICCGEAFCALSHPLRRNNAAAMGAKVYFIIFSQDERRPPRKCTGGVMGRAMMHLRASTNNQMGSKYSCLQ